MNSAFFISAAFALNSKTGPVTAYCHIPIYVYRLSFNNGSENSDDASTPNDPGLMLFGINSNLFRTSAAASAIPTFFTEHESPLYPLKLSNVFNCFAFLSIYLCTF
eukprot:842133_1